MSRTEEEEVELAKRRGATIRRSRKVEAEITAQSKRDRALGRIESGLTEAELLSGYRQEEP